MTNVGGGWSAHILSLFFFVNGEGKALRVSIYPFQRTGPFPPVGAGGIGSARGL